MAYPTAAEIRNELAALAAANAFCSIMTLPKTSLNGNGIDALKISKITQGKRAKVLFTGGIHANELAPPKAILSCMKVLLDAYKPPGKAITYGAFSLTPADVADIVEHIDIYAAPMINPDGYTLALGLIGAANTELAGRKNASPTGACVLPERPGVNLNRNFDIVWNFEKHYAPAPGHNVATSNNPCHSNYSGVTPGPVIGNPFSEPEAENVKTLLEEGVEFFVDCHMYGPTILHSWGIESNQTADDKMWFGNPAWDGKRNGTLPVVVPQVDYKEFIPPMELAEVEQIANHMAKAIKDGTDVAGRGVNPFKAYVVQPGALFYPTSGSADDYAYSRAAAGAVGQEKRKKDPNLPFVRAYTLECGNSTHTGFRPTAAQYTFVEQEVHCALLSLLQFVAIWIGKQNTPPPPSTCPLVLLLGMSHPAVELLRQMRDVAFRETALGRRFIEAIERAYSIVAPPLARWLAPRRRLQTFLCRIALEPAIAVLGAASAAATRLPSPSLRVAALIVAVASIGGLPLVLVATLIGGVVGG